MIGITLRRPGQKWHASMNLAALPSASIAPAPAAPPAASAAAPTRAKADTSAPTPAAGKTTATLTPEALVLIDQLKARDTEVRQHEQAHLAAAGGLAVSGAAYTYQRGPNGVDYAVGGEVHIDTSPGRTPEETIARAHTIAAAALAPAEPSGADRSVAAQAQQLEQQARTELATQQLEQQTAQLQAPPTPTAGARQDAAVKRAYDIAPPVQPTLNTYA
jgi:hypothetical protein